METYWIQTALLVLAAFIIGLVIGKLLRKVFCRPAKHFDYGRDEPTDPAYHKPNYGLPGTTNNRTSHLSSVDAVTGAAGLAAGTMATGSPDTDTERVEPEVELPDSRFPGAKFSDFTANEPDTAADTDMSSIDVELPAAKLEAPDVDLPESDTVPAAETEIETTLPEIKTPEADVNIDDVDIDTESADTQQGVGLGDLAKNAAVAAGAGLAAKVVSAQNETTTEDSGSTDPEFTSDTPDTDDSHTTQNVVDTVDTTDNAVDSTVSDILADTGETERARPDTTAIEDAPELATPDLDVDAPDVSVSAEVTDAELLYGIETRDEARDVDPLQHELETLDAELGVDLTETNQLGGLGAASLAGSAAVTNEQPPIETPASDDKPETTPTVASEERDTQEDDDVTDAELPSTEVKTTEIATLDDTAVPETPVQVDVESTADTWPEDEQSTDLTGMATGAAAMAAGAAMSGTDGDRHHVASEQTSTANSVQESLTELIHAEMSLPASGSAVRIKVLELDDCTCSELELDAENEITLTTGGKGKLNRIPCEVTAGELVIVNQKRSSIENGQVALFLDVGIVVCRQDDEYRFFKL